MGIEIKFWRWVFSVLAVGVVLVFFFHVWSVVIPFLLGGAIAYLVYPLVDRLTALGMRQDRVVIILYVTLLAGVLCIGSWFLPILIHELNTALTNLPAYTDKLNLFISEINFRVQGFLGKRFSIPFDATQFMEQLFYKIPSNIMNVAHAGVWVIVIPFVSFFALIQGSKWLDQLFDWTPSTYVESLLGLLAEINATLGGYIRGALLSAMCVGFITMFGLGLIGVDGAILIGFITGLLNVIPFMAPVVGGGLALLVGYFQGLGWTSLLAIAVLYLIVRMMDDFVFIPFIVGSSVHLHPILMVFAILAGIELGGFLGLVFAIPTAAVVKVIVSIILRKPKEHTSFMFQKHILS